MIRNSLFHLSAALALAALSASLPLQAQSSAPRPAPPNVSGAPGETSRPGAEAGRPVGPVATSVGVTRAATVPATMAPVQGSPARRDFAWMVLGGATVIVGSIVGGDGGTIIMITGGVIGLVGLWRYLQYS